MLLKYLYFVTLLLILEQLEVIPEALTWFDGIIRV